VRNVADLLEEASLVDYHLRHDWPPSFTSKPCKANRPC